MAVADKLVKIVVIVFNFLCALFAFGMIVMSSIVYVETETYYKLTEINLHVAPALILTCGITLFIVAFLGCYGIQMESRVLLFVYADILLALVLTQTGIGIYEYEAVLKRPEQFRKLIENAINRTFQQRKEPAYSRMFDAAQRKLQCCGVHSPLDYGSEVPGSCCDLPDTELCSSPIYIQGCSDKLSISVPIFLNTITNVAFIIAAIEFIAAASALYLAIY